MLSKKTKFILPAIFVLAISVPFLGGAFSYLTKPDQSSSDVLGAQSNPTFQEILSDNDQNTPYPHNIKPTSIEIPSSQKPDQTPTQQNITPTRTNTSPELIVEKIVQEPEEAEHEEIEIVYEPKEVTTPPELPEEKIEYSPEEIKLFELNPQQLTGFTNSTISHDSIGIELNQSFTITLPNHANQALINNLQFHPPLNFNKSLNGNQLTITPLNQQRDRYYTFGMLHTQGCYLSLPIDTSNCNTNGMEYWSYALGYTTAVWQNTNYGTSVQGRPLEGTILGRCRTSNCTKIMLTGGLHGSEWRSGDLPGLIRWIKENSHEIAGQDKELYIIPFTNPDGTVLNQRYNARGVNLNRNFPAYWTNYNCPQCGSGPNSEPETFALHELTWYYRPKYLISYHAQWPPNGIIFRGDDNNLDTRQFAQWVADRTGYPIGEFPGFDIVPGDQTVWAEQQGIRSLVIEATYVGNNDWNKNFNMYLALLREI